MRVLLLTNGIAPEQLGGLQRYVGELATALSRAGAGVAVLTRHLRQHDPPYEVRGDGVEILRFQTPAKTNPMYAAAYPAATVRAVWQTVRRRGPSPVLHSHFALQGMALAPLRRPFVHTFHAPVHREIAQERQGSYHLAEPFQRALVAATRRADGIMLARATRVLTLSAYMRDELAALSPGAAPRTEVLLGGVDTERFAPGEGIVHPATESADPLLFCARRLVPRTGVLELVRAMPRVVNSRPDVRLVLAGAGALEQQVRTETEQLMLGDHVQLVGRVSDDDLAGWYRSADLVVVPTQELEGFGLSTAEALACGTPVLGTPAGATPELLADVDPALMTRDVTPEAIAEGVIALIADPARLSRLASRARARVHPRMGWPAIAERHLAVYEELDSVIPGARTASRSRM
jgi:glycosyltransferase involved in cell wall biosynthesis